MARDLNQVTAVLRDALPDGAAITSVTPMTTGFSNDTYLVGGVDRILRLPPAAGAMLDGHDVLAQARIYAALNGTPGAPPVPSVVHIEERADVLGAPFFVMERVAGEAVDDLVLQPWFSEAPDDVRTQMNRDWVSVFASLANVSPLDILGEPVSPEDDLRKWQRFAAAADCPALVDAIERLLKAPAPRTGAPSVVHGDPKLSNIMWRDHRISAVLDWEMSLNSDPISDLAYMLYLFPNRYQEGGRASKLPGMLTRDQVIALWEEVSGRSAKGLLWHEIAQVAKITSIIAEGTNMYVTGRSTDPKLAWFKKTFDHYLGVLHAMLADGGF